MNKVLCILFLSFFTQNSKNKFSNKKISSCKCVSVIINSKDMNVITIRIENKKKEIYKEEIYSKTGEYKLKDYNGDGIKDVLVNYSFDVRGNESFYLYTISKNCQVKKIKNFELIKNPIFNKKNNIIESDVFSGENYKVIYKIINDEAQQIK